MATPLLLSRSRRGLGVLHDQQNDRILHVNFSSPTGPSGEANSGNKESCDASRRTPKLEDSLEGATHQPLPPLRGEIAPGIAIIALTVLLELGAFFGAQIGQATLRQSALWAVLLAAAWTAVAAPVFAAGGRGAFRSLLRAGLAADATLVSLLVIRAVWNARAADERLEPMTLVSVLQAYCTFAALGVLAAGAVNLMRCVPGRHIAAAVVAALLLLAMATPLWCSGPVAATQGETRRTIAALAVWLDPMYSIASALMDSLNYVIHQETLMYNLTFLNDYVTLPSCPWYMATAIYLPLGVVLLAIGRKNRA